MPSPWLPGKLWKPGDNSADSHSAMAAMASVSHAKMTLQSPLTGILTALDFHINSNGCMLMLTLGGQGDHSRFPENTTLRRRSSCTGWSQEKSLMLFLEHFFCLVGASGRSSTAVDYSTSYRIYRITECCREASPLFV